MRESKFAERTAKYFTKWNLLLLILGIGINVILSNLVMTFHLPLFLDTLGTILAGALGGVVPGMVVGFLSNALNAISEPIMLYYGILSVVIGALSMVFSEKGYFKTVKGWILSSFIFVMVAGITGVSITWFLYGLSIGGTSKPIGLYLLHQGVAPYLAQLLGDLVIEIPDKFFMAGCVCFILKYCPKNILDKFPLGEIYTGKIDKAVEGEKVKKSIAGRITLIVIASIFVTSVFAIVVSLVFYMQRVKKNCENFANIISEQEAGYVNGDKIDEYIKQGDQSKEYKETEKNLNVLYKNSKEIKYLFVYKISEDGVRVVFDIDTPSLKGENPGTLLEPEQGVSSQYKKYLHGEAIPNEYSYGEYGNMLTVYSRIYDSSGKVVAYAGVDIDMSSYYTEYIVFAIQVISIIFAVAMLIFTFVLWYIHRHITRPIQLIAHQTEELKDISPEKWMESDVWEHHVVLDTEDELARLNDTINAIEEKASLSMKRVIETEQELLQTKELEEVNKKLEIAVKKAEEANHAKTDFLARMSHDMRTPLNGIMNFSEFINETTSLEEAKEYGEKIFASGQYLETLINDTLGMSRIESGKMTLKPEPYKYEDLKNSIENVLEKKAKDKGVNLRFEYIMELGKKVLIDPLRLQQVCINIINNAIKFTPKGGEVVFKTTFEYAKKENVKLHFVISDTGIGMSEEFLKNELFQPFSQEKTGRDNEETGTGLGLSIAKQLVDYMGGDITCESKEGVGTTFRIDLTVPIAKDVKEDGEEKKLNCEKLKGIHILLCEDHPLNREIAMKLLKKKGCQVDVAENGQQGIQILSEKCKQYDMILMDIRMPVMDGITATKAIRKMAVEYAKEIPIIAMTANAYDNDVEECLSAGMNGHIAKPIQPKVMYETILENL